MAFRDRWVKRINDSASGRKPFGNGALVLTGGAFLILILALIILAFWTDRRFGLPVSPEYPMNLIIGFPLLAFGTGFYFWSVLLFLSVKGTPVPLRPPPKLITAGPYEAIRNPMLTGLFAILFGIGFTVQSVSLVFLYTPVFILLNYLELRFIEEPELEKRLGQEYMEYRKRTPMFFPKWKRQR